MLAEGDGSREGAEEVSANRFARAKHARYLERGVVYHVISRRRGNLFLLRPDLAGKLRATIAGVLAEAKSNWEPAKVGAQLHCPAALGAAGLPGPCR